MLISLMPLALAMEVTVTPYLKAISKRPSPSCTTCVISGAATTSAPAVSVSPASSASSVPQLGDRDLLSDRDDIGIDDAIQRGEGVYRRIVLTGDTI